MKNLILNIGFPQALVDYWLLLDSNAKDTALLQMAPFGSNVILAGCKQTVAGANLNIAEGVVFFNGQPMRVAAHTIADFAGSVLIAQQYETTLLTNPKAYGNGSTNEPMLTETKCRFVKKTSETLYVELSQFMPFGVLSIASEGAGYTLENGATFGSFTDEEKLTITLTFDRRLILNGGVAGINMTDVTISGVSNCIHFATLDVAYRPLQAIQFAAYAVGITNSPNISVFVLFPLV